MTSGRPAEILFYGIGAQKAGTTWLFDQLSARPDVALSRPKELHYWDTLRPPYHEGFRAGAALRVARDRPQGLAEMLRRSLNAGDRQAGARMRRYDALLSTFDPTHRGYLDYLAEGAGRARVIGDVTPSYALLSRRTFADMAAIHPEPRFIFIMRDPVARLVSGLRQRHRRLIRSRTVDDATVAELLDASLDEAIDNPRDPDRLRSDYVWTIGELEAAVPANRVLYLFYEDLFEPRAADSIGRHLGLADFTPSFDKRVHSSPEIRYRARPEALMRARQTLAPIYDFVHDRFGTAVPRAWSTDPVTPPETLDERTPT